MVSLLVCAVPTTYKSNKDSAPNEALLAFSAWLALYSLECDGVEISELSLYTYLLDVSDSEELKVRQERNITYRTRGIPSTLFVSLEA